MEIVLLIDEKEDVMPLDSAQIRHRNFMKLFHDFMNRYPNEPRRGMLKAFAEHLQLSERYLSHIKCNRKNIGANLARLIEKRLRLPHGWMDREHDPHTMPLDDKEKIFVATALAFFRAHPTEARDSLMHYFQQQFLDVQ